jgi:uncharacterized protein DUF6175
MKKVAMYALVVLCAVSVACTTVVVKEDKGPEILLPGEFIEAVDANVIRVKCSGIGVDRNAAVLQARKGCVEWMVTNQLAQTPGEKQAYKAAQAQVFAQLDKYIGFPGAGSASGHDKGIKKTQSIGEDKVRVELVEDVQKKVLMDDLVSMGVLKSKDEMLEAVGMPTIMVHPSKANKGKKNRKIMEDLVNSYLTKAKWEVLDAKGAADLNKLVDAIGEVGDAEEDEAAQLALAIGADVYIIFEANKKKKGNSVAYEVGINAYETTTSRKLGSETALSSPRTTWVAGEESAAMMEGLNDAMAKVMPQITDYWKEDAPKGNRFTIVLKNAPKNTDVKLSSSLKKVCRFVKTKSFPTQVNFYAQCKGDNMELAGALSEAIDSKMAGNDYDFLAKNANNLIIVFK